MYKLPFFHEHIDKRQKRLLLFIGALLFSSILLSIIECIDMETLEFFLVWGSLLFWAFVALIYPSAFVFFALLDFTLPHVVKQPHLFIGITSIICIVAQIALHLFFQKAQAIGL